MTGGQAAPAMRDAFLAALDAGDRAAAMQLAVHMTQAVNPLPGMTCEALGLPLGSTYGAAACKVVANG